MPNLCSCRRPQAEEERQAGRYASWRSAFRRETAEQYVEMGVDERFVVVWLRIEMGKRHAPDCAEQHRRHAHPRHVSSGKLAKLALCDAPFYQRGQKLQA